MMHKKNAIVSGRNSNVSFFAERTLIYVLIGVFLFITLSPLIWILSTSLKPNTEAIAFLLRSPEEPTIDNYFFVLTDPTLARSLINSLIVSIGSTALSVAVSALGGYAFARFDFRGKISL